ncbi:MAG TPA: TonB-dependent receptor [Terriglobales bacterium]|nr:TonB-dependent receptor [Terriglobales bacterium]
MEGDFSRKVGSLFVLLLLTASLAFGQGIVTGSISGTVVDQQQAVISGAKVTAEDVGTSQKYSTTTDNTGAFTIRALPVGTYNVSIEATGFQQLRIRNVAVSAGKDFLLGAKTLSIGAAEVVNVESTPPVVESTTAQVSTSFEARKVDELPGVFGGADVLALLVPGVVDTADAQFSNSNGTGISSNGQRGRSNNFQIDGQSNNDNSVAGPSLFLGNNDLIGEFQIVTNNFSAEYGRNSGTIINYVTKSGTNAYHGTLTYFHEGAFTDSLTNLDKNPVLGFCKEGEDPAVTGCSPVLKPKHVRNRGGGTFGGPIIKDKAWFFMSGWADRQRENFTSSTSTGLPTPAGNATLATAFCAGVTPSCPSHPGIGYLLTRGPWTISAGNPTAGNLTTVSVSDGVTTVPVEFGTITRTVPNGFNDWEASGRADIQVTSKDRFFARYLFQDLFFDFAASGGRSAAGYWVAGPGRTQQIGVDWVRNWTNTFVNQFRFSYSRAFFGFTGGSDPNCTVETINQCPFSVAITGRPSMGHATNLPQDRLVNNSQWQDNASWVIGKHTLKFGGEYARQRSPNNFLPSVNGSYSFTSFNNFVRNIASALTLADGPVLFNFKEQDAALYFQDDWRIKDNLTLQLGLRWEYTQQAVNLLHDLTVARESDPSTAFWDTTLPLSRTTFPLIPADTNNFGPNIGFAWTPRFWEGFFGKDKTVIRGGYRVAYDPAFYNIFANSATAAPVVNLGAIAAANRPIPAGTAYNGAELRAAKLPFLPLGVDPGIRAQTDVSPNFHNPYVQQWSLGLQREVTSKIGFEVRYVGNHAVGLFQTINANPRLDALLADFPDLVPSGVAPCSDPTMPGFAQFRPNCEKRLLRRRTNTAWSIYHGLQSRLDVQNWHGLTAGVSYTFSRTIDNVSEIFATFAGGNSNALAQNPFDINQGERGVSGISFPHAFSVYWIYDLPMFKNQQGFVGRLLGGWQINGIHRYRSGQPFNPLHVFWNTGYCDSAFYAQFFGFVDNCRPVLSNSSAPLDSVGLLDPFGSGNLINLFDCDDPFGATTGTGTAGCPFVSPSDVHWIINDDNFSFTSGGGPYQGVGRNTLRGETVNNVDLGIFKNTKINERFTLQFRAEATNLLNRMFRGVPDPIIDDCPLSGGAQSATAYCGGTPGSWMNVAFNSSNRRRMTFGLKLIF